MADRIVVDARNIACPGPITRLVRAYKKAKPGDEIVVLATDPGFKADVKAWCEKTGNELVELVEEDGVIRAVIRVTGKR